MEVIHQIWLNNCCFQFVQSKEQLRLLSEVSAANCPAQFVQCNRIWNVGFPEMDSVTAPVCRCLAGFQGYWCRRERECCQECVWDAITGGIKQTVVDLCDVWTERMAVPVNGRTPLKDKTRWDKHAEETSGPSVGASILNIEFLR